MATLVEVALDQIGPYRVECVGERKRRPCNWCNVRMAPFFFTGRGKAERFKTTERASAQCRKSRRLVRAIRRRTVKEGDVRLGRFRAHPAAARTSSSSHE